MNSFIPLSIVRLAKENKKGLYSGGSREKKASVDAHTFGFKTITKMLTFNEHLRFNAFCVTQFKFLLIFPTLFQGRYKYPFHR